MSRSIEEPLDAYLEAVHHVFRDKRAEVVANSSIRVLLTDDQLLKKLVEAVEERAEFTELARATTDEFLPAHSGTTALDFSIRTYLRFSGVYERLFAGERPNLSDVASDYKHAFRGQCRTLTYVAPLQFVRFAPTVLECGAFQIRKFEPIELDLLLHNRTRRVFAPGADVDTERLCHHPFVCITHQSRSMELGNLHIVFRPEWHTPAATLEIPEPARRALRPLALFDWKRAHPEPERAASEVTLVAGRVVCARPRVPFVFASSDSPLDWPEPTPDLSRLGMKGQADMFAYEFHPDDIFQFDLDQSEKFASFQRVISDVLSKIDTAGPQWAFISKALDFLWSGFSCEGVEQLLWNVTAIEAALGAEKGTVGLTGLLRNRVSAILGTTRTERTDVGKRFQTVYDLRSKYIHGSGDIMGDDIGPQALIDAREFARRTVFWMLGYLEYVNKHLDCRPVPHREALLHALDIDAERRRDLATVFSVSPECFPRLPDWVH